MDVWASTGGAGLGLVWGWLAAGLGKPTAHPVRTRLAGVVSFVALAAVVLGVAGTAPTVAFVVAAGVAAFVRCSWLRQLAAQYGGRETEGGSNDA
jgi:hypothetical protein